MKKLFAILAVLVLFGTAAWAQTSTNTYTITVDCPTITITANSSSTVAVTAGLTVTKDATWTVTAGDYTATEIINITAGTNNPNWVTIGTPSSQGWSAENCSATKTVSATVTFAPPLATPKGPYTATFTLNSVY